MSDLPPIAPARSHIARRTVVHSLWATPVVLAVSATPVFAASATTLTFAPYLDSTQPGTLFVRVATSDNGQTASSIDYLNGSVNGTNLSNAVKFLTPHTYSFAVSAAAGDTVTFDYSRENTATGTATATVSPASPGIPAPGTA